MGKKMSEVRVVEVGPRDGLQNISQVVPTSIKVELIRRLARTGLLTIEATSFVSPKWIPQLADGSEVLKGIRSLTSTPNIQFPVLVPNVKGLERAHECGAKEIAVFVSATEAFSKKNINCTVAESLVRVRDVTKRANELGIKVRGYVSCIFQDPYEGVTDPQQVVNTTQALLDAGCYEVSLGDTLGVGTPADVTRLFTILLRTIPAASVAGHFHDTYGQAVANVVRAYELGIRTFDSSVAGLGGCPFAKGAKGNLSTEDLVYTLEQHGISTGVNLTELSKTGSWISEQLGIANGSRAGAAIVSKLEDQKIASRPTSSARMWKVLESSEDYSVRRSGVNIEICLTRPKNGNALTKSMINALTRLFKDFSDDESVFRIILRAEGKYFCTGMDLKGSSSTEEQFQGLNTLFHTIDACPKTTIAIINGPCFGGGVGLAFVCDIRIATSISTFTLSEVRLGLCPATISKFVIREWGLGYTRSAMLTAKQITASELEKLGVLYAVVQDPSGLESAMEKLLQTLKFNAPGASKLSKDLVRAAYVDSGGVDQAKVIKESFNKMMAGGSEHVYARSKFKEGIKEVDWESRASARLLSKL
ncbi:3-hydroxy-3-methylglutaryl-coenzyme A lyase/3-methylglutaconyl-coenzyme A hydratase [Leptodontidium sp. MPI-SDFR-AT-0119]|nr:3-hydroxy-3-methylglutaryl-coenzyme A lyase/3-methylglutaconyl-coenzyme A hydratase [Leptodontidium sp. MPI-SDFR-AT-0119]